MLKMKEKTIESLVIQNGMYLIFQKKNYKKIHLLSEKTDCLFMGKDKIEINGVIGKAIGSIFKLIPKAGHNRHFMLQICQGNDVMSTKESLKELCSGNDNRSLCDDGSSQMLTKDSIEDLRDSGIAPQAILGQLVENSKTFQLKTEYSQEKYIEKKERKYFEFITVKLPTIRLLADIFYNRDIPKSVGIRIDTLSQFATALNFQSTGRYILVESGYHGIVAATLLNLLSEEGKLVLVTPENQNQKQAVLAMNFSSSHLSQLITIRFSTLTLLLKKDIAGAEVKSSSLDNGLKCETTEKNISTPPGEILRDVSLTEEVDSNCEYLETQNSGTFLDVRKRKNLNDESSVDMKKPRWMTEAELAVETISKKVDGLVIACREYPSKILDKLLEFILPSRPFVVYSLYQEPLVSLYVELKKRKDIINLHITETLCRPYQILPERSHPLVTVSSNSGFLLNGIKVLK